MREKLELWKQQKAQLENSKKALKPKEPNYRTRSTSSKLAKAVQEKEKAKNTQSKLPSLKKQATTQPKAKAHIRNISKEPTKKPSTRSMKSNTQATTKNTLTQNGFTIDSSPKFDSNNRETTNFNPIIKSHGPQEPIHITPMIIDKRDKEEQTEISNNDYIQLIQRHESEIKEMKFRIQEHSAYKDLANSLESENQSLMGILKEKEEMLQLNQSKAQLLQNRIDELMEQNDQALHINPQDFADLMDEKKQLLDELREKESLLNECQLIIQELQASTLEVQSQEETDALRDQIIKLTYENQQLIDENKKCRELESSFKEALEQNRQLHEKALAYEKLIEQQMQDKPMYVEAEIQTELHTSADHEELQNRYKLVECANSVMFQQMVENKKTYDNDIQQLKQELTNLYPPSNDSP